MAAIAIVAGMPGSGKSTLLNSIKGYKIANIGDIMLKHAQRKEYASDRDRLRFLSNAKIGDLRLLAFKEVLTMKGNILIDTHASVEQNGRYVPGLPKSCMDMLERENSRVRALVYIDAPTNEILARRKKDSTRKRENEPVEIIEMQRTVDMASLARYSSDLNIPMYIIINRQGMLKKSTALLNSYLKDIFG